MVTRWMTAALVLVAATGVVVGEEIPWTFEPLALGGRADPPIPNVDVQLMVDDDSADGVFGVGVPTASQFLWFNRFSPGLLVPLRLDEVWVLFPPGANMTVGAPVEIVIWHDPDGDPTTGADLLLSFDDTIQAVDGDTFSVYPLTPGLEILAPGDILIGVVNRFVTTGVTPTTRPAAIDTGASQGRSWLAVWSGDPPSPPLLPSDGLLEPVDGFVPGNWMIRAFGERILGPAIPTLDPLALAALAAALAAAGALILRRG